jgi:peptidoglycan/LPS O-acetylase OafA/YrhL
MKKRHFYWIDWLRFLAALMVVVCHARGFNWVEWGKLSAKDHTKAIQAFFLTTRPAREWVIVFFVLSGFLVGGKVIEQSLKKTFDPLSFAIDRITRIWLPLIPALLLTAIIECYLGFPIKWLDMLGNLAALQGVTCDIFDYNMPLWSLSYEVWFYVLAGCVAMIVTKTSEGLLPFVGVAVSFTIFTRLDINYLNCWLLGALSYFLVSRQKVMVLAFFGLFLALIGTVSSQFQSDSNSFVKGHFWFLGLLPSKNMASLILSCGIGLIVADICHRKPHSLLSIKVEELGTRLASFSYTLYLTHYPLLNLWESFIPKRSPQFDVASFLIFGSKVLSCLAFGWLIYLPFEARTVAVKSWLKHRYRNDLVKQ